MTEYGGPLLARMLIEQLSRSSPPTPQQLAQRGARCEGDFSRNDGGEQESLARPRNSLPRRRRLSRPRWVQSIVILLRAAHGHDAESGNGDSQLSRLIIGDGRRWGREPVAKTAGYFWGRWAHLSEQWCSTSSILCLAFRVAEVQGSSSHSCKVDYRVAASNNLISLRRNDTGSHYIPGYERDVAHVRRPLVRRISPTG